MGRPVGSKNRKSAKTGSARPANKNDTNTTGSATGTGTGTDRTGTNDDDQVSDSNLELIQSKPLVDVPVEVPQPKKRRSRGKKKEQTPSIPAEDIALFIVGISTITVKRGNNIWELDNDEAMLLANPLSRVLAKHIDLTKHSDEAMLLLACLTVLGPRMYAQIVLLKSNNQKKVKNVNKKRTDANNTSRAFENTSDGNKSDRASVTSSFLPAIG